MHRVDVFVHFHCLHCAYFPIDNCLLDRMIERRISKHVTNKHGNTLVLVEDEDLKSRIFSVYRALLAEKRIYS